MARVGNVLSGKYRLVELIGEGSMGSVWRAVHESLGRPFAVKFLKNYGGSAARIEERFLAEARLAAAVHHRFVVAVVDVGQTDEGTPFMVMEHLHGLTLADRLRRDPPLGVVELLRTMQQALLGLEAVHQSGILHRDLKPENIILCPESDGVIAKLVDFGISRELADSPSGTPGERLTTPGTALGTPLYMAPEQAQGAANIDRRGDVYAAGVILYEALSGNPPYQHEQMSRILELAALGNATPLHLLRPDLPRDLSDLVAHAMAPDPEDRCASAAELAAGLRALEGTISPTAVCGPLRRPPIEAANTNSGRPRVHDEKTTARSANTTRRNGLARLRFAGTPLGVLLIGVAVATATAATIPALRKARRSPPRAAVLIERPAPVVEPLPSLAPDPATPPLKESLESPPASSLARAETAPGPRASQPEDKPRAESSAHKRPRPAAAPEFFRSPGF